MNSSQCLLSLNWLHLLILIFRIIVIYSSPETRILEPIFCNHECIQYIGISSILYFRIWRTSRMGSSQRDWWTPDEKQCCIIGPYISFCRNETFSSWPRILGILILITKFLLSCQTLWHNILFCTLLTILPTCLIFYSSSLIIMSLLRNTFYCFFSAE